MKLARPITALLAVLLVACGGHAGAGSPGGSLRVLTAAEIQTGDYDTLYDAILALRSNWVRERPSSSYHGTEPERAQVFVDGMHRGDVDSLRQLPPDGVERVRYLTTSEAASAFGRLAQAGPAIVVTSRFGP